VLLLTAIVLVLGLLWITQQGH